MSFELERGRERMQGRCDALQDMLRARQIPHALLEISIQKIEYRLTSPPEESLGELVQQIWKRWADVTQCGIYWDQTGRRVLRVCFTEPDYTTIDETDEEEDRPQTFHV